MAKCLVNGRYFFLTSVMNFGFHECGGAVWLLEQLSDAH